MKRIFFKRFILKETELENLFTIIQESFFLKKNYNNFIIEGELGSGKTFFINSFLRFLKIKENFNSNSFLKHQEFNSLFGLIAHFDFFLVHAKRDRVLKELLYDYLKRKQVILFIEWFSKFFTIFKVDTQEFSFNFLEIKITFLKKKLKKREYTLNLLFL